MANSIFCIQGRSGWGGGGPGPGGGGGVFTGNWRDGLEKKHKEFMAVAMEKLKKMKKGPNADGNDLDYFSSNGDEGPTMACKECGDLSLKEGHLDSYLWKFNEYIQRIASSRWVGGFSFGNSAVTFMSGKNQLTGEKPSKAWAAFEMAMSLPVLSFFGGGVTKFVNITAKGAKEANLLIKGKSVFSHMDELAEATGGVWKAMAQPGFKMMEINGFKFVFRDFSEAGFKYTIDVYNLYKSEKAYLKLRFNY